MHTLAGGAPGRGEDVRASGATSRLEVREGRPEDSEEALALRNRAFPPIGPDLWPQSQTAAVARLEGRLVGVVPFTIRSFEVAPDVALRAAFANSVAVDESLRDRGIGTRMMAAAREFLADRAEAMCVYTGREAGGPQYRFYHRTGHHDLLYPRRLAREVAPGATMPAGAEVVPADRISGHESELLEVYSRCYSGCGGSPRREPGYWRRALDSHIFVEIPYEAFDLLMVRQGGELAAYALVGTREGETVGLECASRHEGASGTLWEALGALASRRWAERVVVYGQDLNTPLYVSLRDSGFVPRPRDDVLAGQVISPERVYDLSLQASRKAVPSLEIWTPERTLGLGPDRPRLHLEMKEELLHRLLLRRLDLEAAVREQVVTVREGGREQVRAVAKVLAPVPWVYHHLDYI